VKDLKKMIATTEDAHVLMKKLENMIAEFEA